ncbi:MAG: hypothetical protein K9H06_18765 [Melioribacteraceae bacterium]|nr:hypothetical protein [Bacteroidales bacterium]MCF8395945.1 hypothetical protein [Melioribacteraceae bacterium]
METTIRINTDSISDEFIQTIKGLFPHQTVEITIQPADETEYILSNPLLTKALEERIANYETKKKVIILKDDELI